MFGVYSSVEGAFLREREPTPDKNVRKTNSKTTIPLSFSPLNSLSLSSFLPFPLLTDDSGGSTLLCEGTCC